MKPNVRLKREREQRGWSQARVAEEIGVYPQSVSRWERGIAQPYPYFREKLCTLFALDAVALGFLQEAVDTVEQLSPPPEQSLPQIFTKALTTRVVSPLLLDPLIPPMHADSPAFIRRDTLLSHLKQQLLSSEPWTILRGLPGVGKTTLALMLAYDPDIQAHFRAGIFWAGLCPPIDVSSQLQHWARLLDAMPNGTDDHSYERLVLHLRCQLGSDPILFILDDARDIATLLALKIGGEHARYLVTTRFSYITHYFPANATWQVPVFSEQESMALLAHYVPELLANEEALLHKLVDKTGGLPLAITVIGSYLRAQAATGQSRRLRSALQLLAQSHTHLQLRWPQALIAYQSSTPIGATSSLATTIESSFQRLDESARQALSALSLFPPGPNSCSEEAILSICQIPVEVVDTLSDIGLLENVGEGRYQLHRVIADYARLHLVPDEQTVQRFIDYILRFVEANRVQYNALDPECLNILAGLDYAWQLHLHLPYIRGVIAFIDFLEVRAAYGSGEEHLQRAYQAAKMLNEPVYISIMLFHLGQIARAQHQLLQAETYLREGLVYARNIADRKMVNHFLITIAEVLEQRGEYAQAHVHLHKGLVLARYLKDEERAIYHRVPINYSKDAMCVHFTEPQSMLERGYLANIDELFRSWPSAGAISSEMLNIVTGPDGAIYGIPVDAYVLCLAYNRRLFREAGLDPEQPPTTWEEFRAMARQIARSHPDRYGYAAETISGQGGWHFTNWLYTAGIRAQCNEHGSWHATFNTPEAVQLLDMFKEMRFSDRSIPRQTFLDTSQTENLLASGQVGMIVTSPHLITTLFNRNDVSLDDIGLAPMPQNGGGACLMGGVAYVFNAKSSLRAIKPAFEQILTTHFHIENYEAFIRETAEAGSAVGVPYMSLFKDRWRRVYEKMELPYINVPRQHYKHLIESTVTPWLEPPIEAQKYYALIDPIMQEMLTESKAQPQSLLDTAAHQFQKLFLEELRKN